MPQHHPQPAARARGRAWLPWRSHAAQQDTSAAAPTTRALSRPTAHRLDWVRTSLRSVYGLLHQPVMGAQAPTPAEVNAVRQAMLEALRATGSSAELHALAQRITYAPELRSLWYLRSDLMGLLACAHGEEHARLCVAALTQRFRGLLPEAGGSRRR